MLHIRNNHGLTFIEAAVAMAMLAVIFAGIGYMAKTVPMNQRAQYATQRDEDALKLSYLLTKDIKHASEVILPADTAVLNGYPCSSELRLKSKIWDETSQQYLTKFIKYQIDPQNDPQHTKEIRRCEVVVNPSSPSSADCTPTAVADNLLSSWANGSIRVEDHTNANAGYPNGSRFCRGNDWDKNGVISERERHYVWIQFVLSLNEGPNGSQNFIDEQVYYIEALANVNDARMLLMNNN